MSTKTSLIWKQVTYSVFICCVRKCVLRRSLRTIFDLNVKCVFSTIVVVVVLLLIILDSLMDEYLNKSRHFISIDSFLRQNESNVSLDINYIPTVKRCINEIICFDENDVPEHKRTHTALVQSIRHEIQKPSNHYDDGRDLVFSSI